MFTPRPLPQLGRIMASVQNYSLRQRRFAPLNPERKGTSSAPPLKGIVFDVDGTLWYLILSLNHVTVARSDG